MVKDKEVQKFMDSIGDTIKKRRCERGMTQIELARKAGVSDSIISLIERRERKSMTVAILVKIIGALDGEFRIENVDEEVDIVIPIKL